MSFNRQPVLGGSFKGTAYVVIGAMSGSLEGVFKKKERRVKLTTERGGN